VGLVSAATIFVTGAWSFYLLRFLLGAAEAGFFPASRSTSVTGFRRLPDPRRRMVHGGHSDFIGGRGVLSGALLQMNGILGLAGWKWLFILEGLPVTVLGLVVLRVLTERPEEATWLTDAERAVIRARVAGEVRHNEVRKLLPALTDVRVLILAAVQFGFLVGSYGVGIWLPQIVKQGQLSNFEVGLVTSGVRSRRLR
jgi:MFS family permease